MFTHIESVASKSLLGFLLIMLPAMFAFLGVAAVLMWYTGVTDQEALSIVCGLALLVVAMCFLVNWIRNRRAAGSVLVSYGARHKRIHNILLVVIVAVFFILNLSHLLTAELTISDMADYAETLMIFSIILMSSYSSSARIQLCQNGILGSDTFLKWHDIVSYGWAGESECVLQIYSPFNRGLSMWDGLEVPPEFKEIIEQQLQAGRTTS